MNPNLAQTLDPKLKEAYDRVMGTQLNTQKPQPLQSQPAVATPAQQTAQTPAPEQPKEQTPQVEMVNINTPTSQGETTVAAPAKKSKMKPVIFVIAGVLFFAIYTFIWLKFFSVI